MDPECDVYRQQSESLLSEEYEMDYVTKCESMLQYKSATSST